MANIEIKMSEIVITRSDHHLMAFGVGSCLIVTLFDSKRRISAMAHAMLPKRPQALIAESSSESETTDHRTLKTKYVDTAIDEMIKSMERYGARRENMESKIVGGANMFSALKSDIGRENVISAKEKLKKEGIALVGESVGGSQGRSVEFSVASGIVTVKMKF